MTIVRSHDVVDLLPSRWAPSLCSWRTRCSSPTGPASSGSTPPGWNQSRTCGGRCRCVIAKEKNTSKKSTLPLVSALLFSFRSPLVELRVEVPLLGGGPPLRGGLFVRQQHKGHVRVGAVLGAGCQGSAGVKLKPGTREHIGTAALRREILLRRPTL